MASRGSKIKIKRLSAREISKALGYLEDRISKNFEKVKLIDERLSEIEAEDLDGIIRKIVKEAIEGGSEHPKGTSLELKEKTKLKEKTTKKERKSRKKE